MTNSPDYRSATTDAGSFLMGGGVPSAAFIQFGASVSGTISEPPTVSQQRDMNTNELKTWGDGNPMMQLVVTLQTEEIDPKLDDDDGRRRIYVKFNLKAAVADAVRKTGAKQLEVGGKLSVTYVRDGEQTKRGFNPPKLYAATYSPPSANFLNEADRDEIARPLTLNEAVAACAVVGMSRDDVMMMLKDWGLTAWNGNRDTPRVMKEIQDRKRFSNTPTSGGIEEENISF